MKHPTPVLSPALVSRYRQPIMGTAILWIMLLHEKTMLPEGLIRGFLLSALVIFLDIGVDIFLLISGMGTCRSLSHTFREEDPARGIGRFYLRRCKRILPCYVLVVVLYCVIRSLYPGDFSWQDVFDQFSLITFFTRGNLTEWFIAAILLLYFFSPLLYRVLENGKTGFCVLMAAVAAAALAIALLSSSGVLQMVNAYFFARIPVFMTGMLLDDRIRKEAGGFRLRTVVLFCLLLYVPYSLNRLFNGSINELCIERLLSWPIALCLTLLLGHFFEKHENSVIYRVCAFLGTLTLELYLTHEKILKLILHSPLYPIWGSFVPQPVTGAISILAAIGLSYLLQQLFRKASGGRKKKAG